MANIRLDDAETALWNEVGSRGDAFRAATMDRAAEEVRVSGRRSDVIDDDGKMVESRMGKEPVPESVLETQPGPDGVPEPKIPR